MSDLRSIEKMKLEKMFEMQSGYVCDFSNRTFGDFVLKSSGIDVYSPGYDKEGTSKAYRLRYFWEKESNYLVAKLTEDMLEYCKTQKIINDSSWYGTTEDKKFNESLYEECKKIVERLKSNTVVGNIEDLIPVDSDRNFDLLLDSIKESLKRDKPEQAIDRLHVYVVKYIRMLCDNHSVPYDDKVPLHGLFGSYVKKIKSLGIIESEMTFKILRSSISLLEEFNKVRNNQSLAHDNSVLNYYESILLINGISNIVKFIMSVENRNLENEPKSEEIAEVNIDDIPF